MPKKSDKQKNMSLIEWFYAVHYGNCHGAYDKRRRNRLTTSVKLAPSIEAHLY